MNIIFLVAERLVAVGNDLQQVYRLITVVPRLLRELYAACGGKGSNLVLHVGDAMVDEHRAHGEARPIYTVFVDVIEVCQFIDSLDDEVLVFRAAGIPCVAIAAQVGYDEFLGVNQHVHLVGAILVFRVLVHTMGDDEQR